MSNALQDRPRHIAPPRLARWLLGRVLPRANRAYMLGDLHEEFAERVRGHEGLRGARRWYWKQARAALTPRRAPKQFRWERRKNREAHMLDTLRQDIRYAMRNLRRQPAFTAVVVLTLALAIGANSAIFALVDATLLRPLPFPDPERLVMMWERNATSARGGVAPLNLLDWNERTRSFERISGFIPNVGGMVMSGADGTADTVPRQWVLAGIFDALGIKAIAGRTFLDSDDRQRANVVVLSEGFWRSRFNADPSVVGRAIRLDGTPYTVVGVVPQEAQVIGRASIWALVPITGAPPAARRAYFLRAIGRLKPGVTLEAANADMAGVAKGLAREYPATNKGRGVTLAPMRDAVIGSELRLTSMLFLGVVGFVLLICCANVANLLLARATARTRELAVRSALGAGRRRLMRQLLTESLVLSATGGLLGAAAGAAILRIAPAMIPQGLLSGAVTLSFDLRVAAFCAVTALLVGLLFGLAPAWQATGVSAVQSLASGSRTATARGGRVRSLLVVGEVATAVVVLIGAGLLLRTLLAVENVERGYEAEGVLTMLVDPLGSRYPNPASLTQFFEAVEGEIRALPGVRSVGWASTLPLGPSDAGQRSFEIVGDPQPEESQRPIADYQIVGPTYFQTLDLPVVAGRAFTDRDTPDGVPVCIVNEALVRRHFEDRSPIGARLALRTTSSAQAEPFVREIVGVARQVKGRPDETEDFLQIYVPMAQDLRDDIYLLVRPASGPAEELARSVRAAIARVDQAQLVSVRDVMTLEAVAWEATARHRFRAVLVMTFAALALLLAMVGVFGILAYAVQQQVRDFGVRMALGATTGDVLRLVVGSAGRVIATGVVIGLIASAMLSRLLTSVLFGVEPWDPVTFASVTILLVFTAALATAAPAWRAARIDPAVALRSE
ncbi:MAG: ADOP family duplicated permease [Candidatus Acidiferrales bacterium]